MDLIGGYLLVLLILFAANITLLFGNYKINNSKLFGLASSIFIVSAVLMFISNTFLKDLSYLMIYFNYLFLVLSIAIFLIIIYYSRDGSKSLRNSIILMMLLFAVMITVLSFAAQLSLFEILTYSLFGFAVTFLVYKLSRLLVHAKREYPVIVREFMCLFAVLIFIFSITFNSVLNLDYKLFNPFLILTPTYQLIYIIIAIIIGVIIGFVYDDIRGGNS